MGRREHGGCKSDWKSSGGKEGRGRPRIRAVPARRPEAVGGPAVSVAQRRSSTPPRDLPGQEVASRGRSSELRSTAPQLLTLPLACQTPSQGCRCAQQTVTEQGGIKHRAQHAEKSPCSKHKNGTDGSQCGPELRLEWGRPRRRPAPTHHAAVEAEAGPGSAGTQGFR